MLKFHFSIVLEKSVFASFVEVVVEVVVEVFVVEG